MQDRADREALIDTMLRVNGLGLNRGTSGNASLRSGADILITPSGVPYEALTPDDIVRLRLDGSYECPNPARRPSSEWRFHRDILAARPDLGALLHTHGVASTTLACLRRDIPAFHYMIALSGGAGIRCAPYATPGGEALSRHAVEALKDRKVCLLANHGMIVGERDIGRALALGVEMEALAEMYWRALQVGEPALLTDAEMTDVFAAFDSYYKAAGKES